MVVEKDSSENKSQASETSTEQTHNNGKESVGAKDYARIFSYADRWDWTLNGVGAIAAIASGTSLAL